MLRLEPVFGPVKFGLHRATCRAVAKTRFGTFIKAGCKNCKGEVSTGSFERVLRGGNKSHRSTVEALVSALVSAVEPPVTYG
jgi:hypothetical protein